MIRRLQLQILVGFAIVFALLALLIWTLSRASKPIQTEALTTPNQIPVNARTESGNVAVAIPSATPILEASPSSMANGSLSTPSPTASLDSPPQIAASGQPGLLIPVAGVRPEELQDTYSNARSEGRVHNAIDIMAPQGTPVIAAADGPIHKLFYSERGGNTIYQLSTDGKTVYYYAHLDRYAETCAPGRFTRRGEVIGYVGDTGNAGAGNYHLHFSVSIITDPKQLHDGTPVNPYPLLRQAAP